MKYTFKYQFASVPTACPGPFGDVQYTQICTGGCYLSDDEKSTIDITPYEVVLRNIDQKKACMDYINSFFPKEWWEDTYNPTNYAYIGKWPEDESDIKLYYFIQDNTIHKLFAVINNSLNLTSIGCQYIVNYDGQMLDSIPEEGDIIFSSYEEAEKYKNKVENV